MVVLIVQRAEDETFSETQEVKLRKVLPHELRDVLLSCAVCGESHEYEPKQ